MPDEKSISQLELESKLAYEKMTEDINNFLNACRDYTTLLSDEEKSSLGYNNELLDAYKTLLRFFIDYKTPEDYYLRDKDYVSPYLGKDKPSFIELYDKAVQSIFEYKDAYFKYTTAYDSRVKDYSFLDKMPSGNVIDKQTHDTSILDNYRNWGIDRICLDGFQNHLPEDSKGNDCFLQFMVDGKWVECEEARLHKDKITKIRFADNGVGFSSKNLKFLSSQKTSEDRSVGQFGEGLKLMAMAAVNLGLDLEIQSQNWKAKAYGKKQTIENYRSGEKSEEERKQLTWDVETYDGEPIVGSRTIFNRPTPELIDYALKLPELILELSKEKVFTKYDNSAEITSIDKGGKAFVKGVYLKDINSFFNYNFITDEINPDRNDFSQNFYINVKMEYLLLDALQNKNISKALIYKLLKYYENKGTIDNLDEKYHFFRDPIECIILGKIHEHFSKPDSSTDIARASEIKYLFKKYFEQYYAEKYADGSKKGGILLTETEKSDDLMEQFQDYELVKLPSELTSLFLDCGIASDMSVVKDYTDTKISTAISIDYGAELWDKQKILIDACQNHLPEDSKGKNIFLKFQTKDGRWHDYTEFPNYDDSEIKAVKISDDGIGYDFKSLGILASTKDNSTSSGKWGEGLKMIAAASLREGEKIKFVSRTWEATPTIGQDVLNSGEENEKAVDLLEFNVRDWTKKTKDFKNPLLDKDEMSATIFEEPSSKMLELFRNIDKSVLIFSEDKPFFSCGTTDILDLTGGNIFVRNLFIPDSHQTKYSYHFKDLNIDNRDRNCINTQLLKDKLFDLIFNIKDKRFMKLLLKDAEDFAKDPAGKDYLEFTTNFYIPSMTENADRWIEAFQEFFGENACINKMSNQDALFAGQANHVDLEVVTLPDYLANALLYLKSRDGKSIPSYEKQLEDAFKNQIQIPESELTKKEKAIIEQLYSYNKLFEMRYGIKDAIKTIKIFDYPTDYDGFKIDGRAKKLSDTVSISRNSLKIGLTYATDVFLHEATHAITGAKDADSDFRDFLSNNYAWYLGNTFPLQQSVIDNGLTKELLGSKFENFIRKVLQKIAFRRLRNNAKTKKKEETDVGR